MWVALWRAEQVHLGKAVLAWHRKFSVPAKPCQSIGPLLLSSSGTVELRCLAFSFQASLGLPF